MKYFWIRTVAAIALCGSIQTAYADDQLIAKTLASDLKNAQASSALNDFKIGVRVENGVVWMTGNVASPGQRDEALAIARAVDGVKLVVNDLAVGDAVGGATTEIASTRAPLSESRRQELEQGQVAKGGDAVNPQAATQPAGFYADSGFAQNTPFEQSSRNFMPSSRTDEPSFGPPPMAPSGAFRSNQLASATTPRMAPERSQVRTTSARTVRPVPMQNANRIRPVQHCSSSGCGGGAPMDMGMPAGGDGSFVDGGYASSFSGGGPVPEMGSSYGSMAGGIGYESPAMPGYAWPSYAAHPNYAAVTYPKQYSPMAWPYIGPFYPYPQVPLGWRKVTLEWDDGWWMLDFNSK